MEVIWNKLHKEEAIRITPPDPAKGSPLGPLILRGGGKRGSFYPLSSTKTLKKVIEELKSAREKAGKEFFEDELGDNNKESVVSG